MAKTIDSSPIDASIWESTAPVDADAHLRFFQWRSVKHDDVLTVRALNEPKKPDSFSSEHAKFELAAEVNGTAVLLSVSNQNLARILASRMLEKDDEILIRASGDGLERTYSVSPKRRAK